MSKGSLFWGKGSGKLGETVLYRAGGEQRTRTYVEKIKNPKTKAQMLNRISMANFASFYRKTKNLLSESFLDRPSNQSGYNAFVSASKNGASPCLFPAAAKNGYSVPANFVISSGKSVIEQMNEMITLSVTKDDKTKNYSVLLLARICTSNQTAAAVYPISEGVDVESALVTLRGATSYDFLFPYVFSVHCIFADYMDDGYSIETRSCTFDVEEFFTNPMMGFGEGGVKLSGNLSNFANGAVPFAIVDRGDGYGYLAIAVSESSHNSSALAGGFIAHRDTENKVAVTNGRMIELADSEEHYLLQFMPEGDVYNQVLEYYGYSNNSLV